ncbi:MAG: hypothetical protein M3270_06960 [Thermoproteota archaeon]|nr:hypothetical protein [Thermoproteota archaeon]
MVQNLTNYAIYFILFHKPLWHDVKRFRNLALRCASILCTFPFYGRYMKLLGAIALTLSSMNPHSGTDDNWKNDKNNRQKTKVMAAIPIGVIMFATAILSGLLAFVGNSYQPAEAQQNTTGTSNQTSGAGSTSSSSSICATTQAWSNGNGTGQQQSGMNGTTTGGSGGSMGTNSTGASSGGAGGTQSQTQLIEQACMALQAGDIQGAMMRLDLALGQLGSGPQVGSQGNMSGGAPVNSSPSANSLTGGTTTGGGATAGDGVGTFGGGGGISPGPGIGTTDSSGSGQQGGGGGGGTTDSGGTPTGGAAGPQVRP